MSFILRFCLLVFSVILSIITTTVLKRGRMPIKYSLLWYFSSVIIIILSLFPFVIEWIASLFGFTTLSNLIVAVLISILLFLTMALTIITAGQRKKTTLLIQEISLLKEKVEKSKK